LNNKVKIREFYIGLFTDQQFRLDCRQHREEISQSEVWHGLWAIVRPLLQARTEKRCKTKANEQKSGSGCYQVSGNALSIVGVLRLSGNSVNHATAPNKVLQLTLWR
jgi:hypothetical protein